MAGWQARPAGGARPASRSRLACARRARHRLACAPRCANRASGERGLRRRGACAAGTRGGIRRRSGAGLGLCRRARGDGRRRRRGRARVLRGRRCGGARPRCGSANGWLWHWRGRCRGSCPGLRGTAAGALAAPFEAAGPPLERAQRGGLLHRGGGGLRRHARGVQLLEQLLAGDASAPWLFHTRDACSWTDRFYGFETQCPRAVKRAGQATAAFGSRQARRRRLPLRVAAEVGAASGQPRVGVEHSTRATVLVVTVERDADQLGLRRDALAADAAAPRRVGPYRACSSVAP